MKRILPMLALAVALLGSGCVLGRRTTDLSIPRGTESPKAAIAFSIGEIRDLRRFENHPSDPATPSVDGDVNSLDAAAKAQMIGRQRNTFGGAVGDIALPKGRSVILLTRELLAEALKRGGCLAGESTGTPNSISADIEEFWAWFSPGMWSVSFEARVQCTLSIRRVSDGRTVTIKGYGINKGQVASNANWQLAYRNAFEDFLANAAPEIRSAAQP